MRAIVPILAVCLVPGAAQAADRSLALVRTVPVHAAPPGWLVTEDRVYAALAERFESLVPASVVADLWQAPGFRWDRARERIRAALNGAEEALGKRDLKAARRHLKDVDELLELGAVVASLPPSAIRRFHLLEARLASQRGRGAEPAVSRYLALTGVEPSADLDPKLVERARRGAAQPAGVTIDVKPARAVVFLDGERVGQGDVRRLDVAPGQHYLQVAAEGHEAFGERIELKAGGMVRRSVHLKGFDDPLAARGRALAKNRPAEKEVARIRELAESLGVASVLVLVADGAGMILRLYELELGAWRPAVAVSFSANDVGRLVDQALGRTEGPVALETIDAAPAVGPTATGPVDLDSVEPADEPGAGSWSRWLWVGGGVAAVVGVVIGVLVAGGSDSDTGRATVWLCPGGGPCAP